MVLLLSTSSISLSLWKVLSLRLCINQKKNDSLLSEWKTFSPFSENLHYNYLKSNCCHSVFFASILKIFGGKHYFINIYPCSYYISKWLFLDHIPIYFCAWNGEVMIKENRPIRMENKHSRSKSLCVF